MTKYYYDKQTSVVGFYDVKDLEIAKRMGIGALDENSKEPSELGTSCPIVTRLLSGDLITKVTACPECNEES